MTEYETADLKSSIALGDQLRLPLSTAFAIASKLEGRNMTGEDIHEMGTRFARGILEKEEKKSLKDDSVERFAVKNGRSDEFFDAQIIQNDKSGLEVVEEIFLPDIPTEEPMNDTSES